MTISVFDLFKIGIGPSSSHTVGPMLASKQFVDSLLDTSQIQSTQRVCVELYGSLGATGKGHGSDKAILMGLLGETPDQIDTDLIADKVAHIIANKSIHLGDRRFIDFDMENDLIFFRKKALPFHANGMKFCAFDSEEKLIYEAIYYSVGGGFIVNDVDIESESQPLIKEDIQLPYPFYSGDELLGLCEKHQTSISDIMLRNERVWRSDEQTRNGLLEIWQVMQDCVHKGCITEGILPGGLKVKRRAADMYQSLLNHDSHEAFNQGSMDWVNLFALAVNEENAAGGRVVTAPTNGAAGIIPAVLHYFVKFCDPYMKIDEQGNQVVDENEGVVRFLLTAAAIGILFKENASISGAEVGCQGEVGSACSMAAAALTEVLGGTPEQVENAAEIGIEHNLGLTCDPIGGLVQVPCIERNAMAAVKAINASRLALHGDGKHFVSLDKAIITMRETGKDMRAKYKETARGGLALQVIEVPVNIVEC